ncbi:GCN5 family N-acetyltransferase (plasmid) [Pseudomonas putida]|uniref:GCN5 family N-acetyltransferase n=1 Tax=Pseudomonas putida TaxID=303 RepID=A0A1L7NN10_PSEPU|nr:GCN5 family N-acetyltransferase [Pseudomonas putida]
MIAHGQAVERLIRERLGEEQKVSHCLELPILMSPGGIPIHPAALFELSLKVFVLRKMHVS